MRFIDGDELKTAFPSGEAVRTECVRATIDHMPTIDAVPITRCKDCKWYDTELHCKLNGYGCGMSPDWFCADGKKE